MKKGKKIRNIPLQKEVIKKLELGEMEIVECEYVKGEYCGAGDVIISRTMRSKSKPARENSRDIADRINKSHNPIIFQPPLSTRQKPQTHLHSDSAFAAGNSCLEIDMLFRWRTILRCTGFSDR